MAPRFMVQKFRTLWYITDFRDCSGFEAVCFGACLLADATSPGSGRKDSRSAFESLPRENANYNIMG